MTRSLASFLYSFIQRGFKDVAAIVVVGTTQNGKGFQKLRLFITIGGKKEPKIISPIISDELFSALILNKFS